MAELREKFMADVKAFAELKYPGEDEDENLEREYFFAKLSFICNLAGDYYDNKINESKLFEEFGTISEEEEQKSQMIKSIQAFKVNVY